MEKEIWGILKTLDENKLTLIEAHWEICNIINTNNKSLLKQCLNEQEEVINSPIRFNGIHINKMKQVFLKNGIEDDDIGF